MNTKQLNDRTIWVQKKCMKCGVDVDYGYFADEDASAPVTCGECEYRTQVLAQYDNYESRIKVLENTIRDLKIAMSYRIANLQCQGHQFAIVQLEGLAKEMCRYCHSKMELFPPESWVGEWHKTQEWEHACEDAGMMCCEAPEIQERIKKLKEG